ncbi:MAG: hypothetical protein AAFR44_04585, partial [Pseudomonadota bacterium]
SDDDDKEPPAKKAKVDAALQSVEIVLHRDLYTHAWRGQRAGPMTGMVYDAWPLPQYVAAHLEDTQSSAWW